MFITIQSRKSFLKKYLNIAVENGFTKIEEIKKEAMRLYNENNHGSIDFLTKQEVFKNYFEC